VKLGVQVGLGPDHVVLDGDPAAPPQRGRAPQFSAHICCGQMAGWIMMPLGGKVGLGPSNIAQQLPLRQKGQSPQFSAHFYCRQIVGCIKMLPGMMVGLGPCHILLDETSPPIFGPCLLWPNGSMDQDATWWEGIGLGPSNIVQQLPLRQKRTEPPNFRPISIVAKLLDASRCYLV